MLTYCKIVYSCSNILVGFYFRKDINLYTILFNSFGLYRYGNSEDKYRLYPSSRNSNQDNEFYLKIKQFMQ